MLSWIEDSDVWTPPAGDRQPRQEFAVTAALIKTALASRGIQSKGTGSSKWVHCKCFFHQQKSGEALAIRADGRVVTCFNPTCKANKHNDGPLSWVDVCDALNFRAGLVDPDGGGSEFVEAERARAQSLRQQAERAARREITLPKGRLWAESDPGWRGLPAEYLVSRGALYTPMYTTLASGEKRRILRLTMPIYHHEDGELQGWLAEAFKDVHRRGPFAAEPKCLNMPGLRAEKVLFGLDVALAMNRGYVVLTEGPFDQMRAHYFGIPAASILGTGTWQNVQGSLSRKAKLLVEAGVERVYTLFDRDDAGENAERLVADDMRDWAEVEHLRLSVKKDKTDPGSAKASVLRKIARRLP